MNVQKSILPLALISVFLILFGCSKKDTDSTPENETGTFVDARDLKTYGWVKVGNQVWMTENLAYKTDSGSWAYDNLESNATIYGYLYHWDTAQLIAPKGWHLPSQDEWETLITSLGGSSKAFNKLVEVGTAHWESPNPGTNESKFNALPSGYYDQRHNTFNSLGSLTMFHSTTEHPSSNTNATGLILRANATAANIEGRPKALALPIRCVKD